MRPRKVDFCLAILAVALTSRLEAGQSQFLPSRGNPSAALTILVFSDLQCPASARLNTALRAINALYPDDVQIVFKHSPLPIHPGAPLAHEAIIEAAQQGKFWEMHDLLFANQDRLGRTELGAYAAQVGLDIDQFNRALDGRFHRFAVARDVAEARALGLTRTPTLFAHGRRIEGAQTTAMLTGMVRSLLAGAEDGSPPATPISAFDLKGAPTRGPADAPVTVVQFSDFECSWCAAANRTMREMMTRYEGKIRWIFKHYPLEMHQRAPLAHRASLAAQRQGMFWEMHDAIFDNQRSLERAAFLEHAKRLKLDVERFIAEMDISEPDAILQRDAAEGARLGISSTPMFFINGQPMLGAQPVDVFVKTIETALASVGTKGVTQSTKP